jgi:hypothetical protein
MGIPFNAWVFSAPSEKGAFRLIAPGRAGSRGCRPWLHPENLEDGTILLLCTLQCDSPFHKSQWKGIMADDYKMAFYRRNIIRCLDEQRPSSTCLDMSVPVTLESFSWYGAILTR